ncbi:hypothetical protein Tco_1403880 [Tanacetum coccineum]
MHFMIGGGEETLEVVDVDKEVSLVIGILEGALGALGDEIGSLGEELWRLIELMMNEEDGEFGDVHLEGNLIGRDLFEKWNEYE